MIPAFERFVIGIAIMPLNDISEFPSVDRFEEVPKDAIHVLHARPFLSLDNLKVSGSRRIRRACAAA